MDTLKTDRPQRDTRFGSGWISGVIAASLGVMGFAAVLCLHYPDILTTPELRAVYPMRLIRGLIHLSLIAAFALGVISLVLRRNKTLGAIGVGFATLAALSGGSGVAVDGQVQSSRYIGLDFFLLDLFFLALIFVPIERLYPLWKEQKIFRAGFWTDLAYFFSSHVVVQVTTLLTMAPAAFFFRWAIDSPWQRAIGAQPGWLQFIEILVDRGSGGILDSSPVPRRSLPVAIPRHPSFVHDDGLAGGFAPASVRRGDHARLRLCADVRAGLCARAAHGLSGVRRLPRRLSPRQRALSLRTPRLAIRHAALSPLAPQRRSHRQEFRHPSAGDRLALRHAATCPAKIGRRPTASKATPSLKNSRSN